MGLSKLQQLNITLYTKTQFFLWEAHFFHVHKPDKLNCFGIVLRMKIDFLIIWSKYHLIIKKTFRWLLLNKLISVENSYLTKEKLNNFTNSHQITFFISSYGNLSFLVMLNTPQDNSDHLSDNSLQKVLHAIWRQNENLYSYENLLYLLLHKRKPLFTDV